MSAPIESDQPAVARFLSPPHSLVRPPSSLGSSSSAVAHRDIVDDSQDSSDVDEARELNAGSAWESVPPAADSSSSNLSRIFSPSLRRTFSQSTTQMSSSAPPKASVELMIVSKQTSTTEAASVCDEGSRDAKRPRVQVEFDQSLPVVNIVPHVSAPAESAAPPALTRPSSLPPVIRADSISVENMGLPAPSPTDVLLAETPLPTSPELLLQSQLIQQQQKAQPHALPSEARIRTDSSPTDVVSPPPVESPAHHSSTPFTSPPRIADTGFRRLPVAQLPPRVQISQTGQRIQLQQPNAPELFMTIQQATADLESYVSGITLAMHQRERIYQPFPAYFNSQAHLQPRMRGILFDWMMEVCQEFSLGRETHYLAMNMIDRFLSAHADVPRHRLQLIGVTALWMAAKLDEIYPPRASDFALTTDNAYTVQEMLDAELEILAALEWNLLSATSVSFVKMYLRLIVHHINQLAIGSPSFMERCGGPEGLHELLHSFLRTDNFVRVMEIVDAASLRAGSLQFYPSAIAASALCLIHPSAQLFIHNVTPYYFQQLHPCLVFLHPMQAVSHRGLMMPAQPYFEVNIPIEDSYTRQLHHTDALDFCYQLDSHNC